MKYTRQQIAKALDLAVLKPDAPSGKVVEAARLVAEEGIATICIAPCNVRLAKQYTNRVCAVIGFPHSNTTFCAKEFEAREAIDNGAVELDMVVNYGRFLDGTYPQRELIGVVGAAHRQNVLVKAILETCYLDAGEIETLCEICVGEGVDFVKTSTGFGPGGATPEAVAVMLEAVAGKAQVKASGGIKTYADAARYLDLGCTRLGSSVYRELLP